ncbi:MupG family TIM beta-alpha barrel fold protein [Bombilactobacillus folatiphilus]|uniref:MupG family TIM beta-alpha barrel fold protein n=1 Tax=Bombilactobacillus folatiphilus TaxID=2923362 RepID=A0ABY4P999_9LACO|nr:MupG family TIM beta-alpha barrel fold protein [Bombilactobacillus folatiphilus]UQS82200.1 MupG family TIM beta-alpha barrel fold protein [Bombilactobacillus folatiphilus]
MTKRQLGLSIYPDHSNFEADRKYLELGHKYGYSRIFMSMLEVSGSPEQTKAKFRKIIDVGNDLGYQTIIDVAPKIFDDLHISYNDLSFFHELHAAGIRLDQAFDGATEAMLSYNPDGLIVELNMSNNVDYLNNILSYQANEPFIYGCHNFYPQVGTGLPYDFFVKCSQRFKQAGIHTAAFVASQVGNQGPWNVNDGLPTLEEDRRLPIAVQAKHLFASNLIDDVIIGNAYASEAELADLANTNRYQLEFTLDLNDQLNEVEQDILFKPQHFRRGDVNRLVVRSTMPRVTYKAVANQPHDNHETFQRGDVLIGNDDFGIYKNELQIVLEPHQDQRKNKVGRIKPEELFLLDFIKPWTKFKLNH